MNAGRSERNGSRRTVRKVASGRRRNLSELGFRDVWLFAILVCPTLTIAQDELPVRPAMPTGKQAVEFQRDVLPILRNNCIACHNTKTNENDLILETVRQMIEGGSSGAGLVPGKPDESLVYQVAARSEEPLMPPLPNDAKAKKLTPAELGLLRQWIIEGAKPGSTRRDAVAWGPVNRRLHAIYCVGYDVNTGTVAAGVGNRVAIYDLHSRSAVRWLVDANLGKRTHRDIVQSLAFHPTEPLLVTGGYRTVKFWKPGPATTVVRQLDEAAQRLAVSGDSRIAISSGSRVRIFNSEGAEERVVQAEAVVTAICFGAVQQLAIANANGGVQIFEGLKQQARFELKSVTAMTFGADKTRLLTGHADGSVSQWNLDTNKRRAMGKAGGAVTGIARSPDEKRIAVTTAAGTTLLLDAVSAQAVKTLKGDFQHHRKREHNALDEQVARRRNSHRAARVKQANAEVVSQASALKKANETVTATEKTLAEANKKLAADDRKLAEAKQVLTTKPDDKNLKAKLNAAQKNQAKAIEAGQKANRALAAAKQDVAIIKASLDRAKRSHEQQTALATSAKAWHEKVLLNQAALTKAPPMSPAVSVQFLSETVVETVHANGAVQVWNVESGLPVAAVRSDSQFAAGAGNYALSKNGRKVFKLTRASDWVFRGLMEADGGSIVGRVRSMAFNPSGSLLAIGSGQPSRSGQIQIWDVRSQTLLQEMMNAHSDTVLDLEFSPDGKRLLSSGADKLAKVWNVADGSFVRSFEGHTHHVLGASWQADMTRIVTAGGDKVVKVWDAETGEQKRTIRGHSKQVTGLQCIGGADTLLSSGGDRSIRAFKAGNGRTIRRLSGSDAYVHTLAATRDGSTIVSGSEDGVVRVWNGKDAKPIRTFSPFADR